MLWGDTEVGWSTSTPTHPQPHPQSHASRTPTRFVLVCCLLCVLGRARLSDAIERRDNLAAYMYEQLYDYVITKINIAVNDAVAAENMVAQQKGT